MFEEIIPDRPYFSCPVNCKQIESYISEHSEAEFHYCYCLECGKKR